RRPPAAVREQDADRRGQARPEEIRDRVDLERAGRASGVAREEANGRVEQRDAEGRRGRRAAGTKNERGAVAGAVDGERLVAGGKPGATRERPAVGRLE